MGVLEKLFDAVTGGIVARTHIRAQRDTEVAGKLLRAATDLRDQFRAFRSGRGFTDLGDSFMKLWTGNKGLDFAPKRKAYVEAVADAVAHWGLEVEPTLSELQRLAASKAMRSDADLCMPMVYPFPSAAEASTTSPRRPAFRLIQWKATPQ